MSDGECKREFTCRNPLGNEGYPRGVATVAVAQLCESIGFQRFQHSALEVLSDLAIRYIRGLGKVANFYANLSSRTHCNAFDVIEALENIRNFSQASSQYFERNCSIVHTDTINEIKRFMNLIEEAESYFSHAIPSFSVREVKVPPSFAHMGEIPPKSHIPSWLPAFPDPHTYLHTPVWNEISTDPRTDKMEQARQRRKAEYSLLSLQQRLSNNRTGPRSKSIEKTQIIEIKRIEEKNESENTLLQETSNWRTEESQVSILEIFAPVIEAAKSGLSEFGEKNDAPLLKSRNFTLNKKFLGLPIDFRSINAEKVDIRLQKEDEKDDRKRRAEMILRESMENPQDLAQL